MGRCAHAPKKPGPEGVRRTPTATAGSGTRPPEENTMVARSAPGFVLAVVLAVSPGRPRAQEDRCSTLGGPALAVGAPAPRLDVREFVRGLPVAGFEQGTVYVLEFWKVGCPPCRAAIPHLNDL